MDGFKCRLERAKVWDCDLEVKLEKNIQNKAWRNIRMKKKKTEERIKDIEDYVKPNMFKQILRRKQESPRKTIVFEVIMAENFTKHMKNINQ